MDKAGQTPISLAYSNRHLETVKYLVQEQQCDPNCMLCAFVFTNHVNLVDHSVVVNENGDTPLSLECFNGHLNWVKALFNKYVDPKGE